MKKKDVVENNKQEDFKLGVNLSGISVINFNYSPPSNINLPLPSYKYQIIVKHGIISKTNSIVAIVSGIIRNEEETEILGKIDIAYNFIVINLDSVIKMVDEQLTIDERVLQFINPIAISTSRGIAFAKFQDTAISNAIMPIFDLTKLIPFEVPEVVTAPTG